MRCLFGPEIIVLGNQQMAGQSAEKNIKFDSPELFLARAFADGDFNSDSLVS